MNDLNFEGLTDAQLRLFAVRCVRRVQRLMTDPRSVAVLDVAERHTKGEATDKELSTARAAAADAADAAWNAATLTAAAAAEAADAARDAAWDEAEAAARAAARAAEAAARAAAWAAEEAARAATAAAWAAAWAAERAEQQKILAEVRAGQ